MSLLESLGSNLNWTRCSVQWTAKLSVNARRIDVIYYSLKIHNRCLYLRPDANTKILCLKIKAKEQRNFAAVYLSNRKLISKFAHTWQTFNLVPSQSHRISLFHRLSTVSHTSFIDQSFSYESISCKVSCLFLVSAVIPIVIFRDKKIYLVRQVNGKTGEILLVRFRGVAYPKRLQSTRLEIEFSRARWNMVGEGGYSRVRVPFRQIVCLGTGTYYISRFTPRERSRATSIIHSTCLSNASGSR